MTSRSSHVRTKIVALLLSMAALWVFAAFVTVRDGLNVLFVNTVNEHVGLPTESLVDALQRERRLSIVVIGASSDPNQRELAEIRELTDRAVAQWREQIDDTGLRFAASGALESRIDELGEGLTTLARIREGVDLGSLDRSTALAGYSELIGTGFRVFGSISSLDDPEIARQSRALIDLALARELLSQQDALLAGALAAEEVTGPEAERFAQLVGAQRFLYDRTSSQLSPDNLDLYQTVHNGPEVAELRRLEDMFIQDARPGSPPPFSAGTWQDAVDAARERLREFSIAAAENTLEHATPAVIGVVVRLLLAGGLGLVALIAAVIVSITTARALVRQLERLRDAARTVADERLPRVVRRLSAGEPVDMAADAAPLSFGNDEIGQVGQAFNAVQETAVRAAIQQAELRHGVRDVFLALARRTQSLVHKQLSVLDMMERRETDADEMADLFQIDHMATRMRRNAENLIVLSGASPGRAWRHPIPMIDVVRGALAEVEDYTRVSVRPVETSGLEGRSVGDIIHLLAELIENAVSFSPPYATVAVSGERVARGYVVEVEDRGLGMSDEELVSVNAKLVDPPDFSLADASHLGHYVVAKLAQRHGVQVHLRPSPYGGIVAIVLIPGRLLDDGGAPEPPGSAPPAHTDPPTPPATNGYARPTAAPTPPPATNGHARPTAPSSAEPTLPDPGRRAAPSSAEPTLPDPGRRAAPSSADPELPRRRGTAAVPAPQPPVDSPTQPPAPSGADEAGATPSVPDGLPVRIRQASLPKELPDPPVPDAEEPPRDPELVRQMMRSYQHGTQRARSEAIADGTERIGPSDHPNRVSANGDVPSPAPRHSSTEYPGDHQEG